MSQTTTSAGSALEQLRERLFPLEPQMDAIAHSHRIGFRGGYAQARADAMNEVQALLYGAGAAAVSVTMSNREVALLQLVLRLVGVAELNQDDLEAETTRILDELQAFLGRHYPAAVVAGADFALQVA